MGKHTFSVKVSEHTLVNDIYNAIEKDLIDTPIPMAAFKVNEMITVDTLSQINFTMEYELSHVKVSGARFEPAAVMMVLCQMFKDSRQPWEQMLTLGWNPTGYLQTQPVRFVAFMEMLLNVEKNIIPYKPGDITRMNGTIRICRDPHISDNLFVKVNFLTSITHMSWEDCSKTCVDISHDKPDTPSEMCDRIPDEVAKEDKIEEDKDYDVKEYLPITFFQDNAGVDASCDKLPRWRWNDKTGEPIVTFQDPMEQFVAVCYGHAFQNAPESVMINRSDNEVEMMSTNIDIPAFEYGLGRIGSRSLNVRKYLFRMFRSVLEKWNEKHNVLVMTERGFFPNGANGDYVDESISWIDERINRLWTSYCCDESTMFASKQTNETTKPKGE